MPYPRNSALAVPISSLEYLRILERSAQIASWAWQPSDGMMAWSSNMYRLMRVPAGFQPTVEAMVAAVHEEDRWRLQDLLVGATPVGSTEPYRVRLADGSLRWHVCHREIVRTNPVRVVIAVVQDVTDATDAHHLLVQRRRMLDMVLRLLGGVTWRGLPSGELMGDSAGWRELTGTTLADNMGTGWIDAIHPDDRSRVRHAWFTAVETVTPYAATYRLRTSTGDYIPMRAKAQPYIDDRGSVVEWIGVAVPAVGREALQELDHKAAAPDGNEVRAARALVGLTVEQLAEVAGVSAATISRHEDPRAEGRIRAGKLAQIASAFSALGVTFHREPDGSRAIRRQSPRASKPDGRADHDFVMERA